MKSTDKNLSSLKLNKILLLIFVVFLIILLVASFNIIIRKARDTKRMVDVKQIQTALAVYQSEHGFFPESQNEDSLGWDVSFGKNKKEYDFLNILKEDDIIESVIKDPINSDMNFYRYQKFPAGSYGCRKSFYILQIMNFEQSREYSGYGVCPERDFVQEALNGYTLQVFE